MAEAGLRKEIVAAARRMNALGINQGASGNVSARVGRGFLITPSALAYEAMSAGDIVKISAAGKASGARTPSSEWRIHHDIYAARPDAGAIVHTHSVQATALACLGRAIPAFHYMVAAAGGDSIRCAPYAVFGSQALSDAALIALAERRACLLAHHGVIALGADLDAALGLAVEVEALAAQYLAALGAGTPKTLSKKQMAEVLARFARYRAGQPVEGDAS
jgi:L-fuculose-phosphate aldolase